MPDQKPESPATATATAKRGRGGRPKHAPDTVRTVTIGVRVSPTEFADLKAKANDQGVTPGTWLRLAALSRRLPSPPVPAVNREVYADLAHLASNLNQLAKAANAGQPVAVSDLLAATVAEVKRLRLALLGAA